MLNALALQNRNLKTLYKPGHYHVLSLFILLLLVSLAIAPLTYARASRTGLPICDVTASSSHRSHPPGHTIDGDLYTRWAAEGHGQWIQFKLQDLSYVNQLNIAWYRGNQRVANFKLEASLDGVNWTNIYDDGMSSGYSTQLEPYTFEETLARYIRITGYGNTENLWTSITEVALLGRIAPLDTLAIDHVSANSSEWAHPPTNTLDGDLDTRWSGLGYNATIQFDLEELSSVNQVSIAWFKGNQRQTSFDILVSLDGTAWTHVFYGDSSGTTTQLEGYSFQATSARYVQILCYGNTENSTNSITEVELYTIAD